MHDLIQQMGWKIVCEEHLEKPSKWSRLWNVDDIYQAFISEEVRIKLKLIAYINSLMFLFFIFFMLLIFYLLMILYSYCLGDAKCRNHISSKEIWFTTKIFFQIKKVFLKMKKLRLLKVYSSVGKITIPYLPDL